MIPSTNLKFFALALCAAACITNAISSSFDPLKLPADMKPEIRSTVERSWPKVLVACPGLPRFASDMSFVGVEDNLSYAPNNAKRIEVVFQVRDEPHAVPAEFRARGHRCFFGITPDGAQLLVEKSGCASICKGSEQSGGVKLPLK